MTTPEINVSNLVPVLVTTSHRGVFFGLVDPATKLERSMQLYRIRNCIRWDAEVGGFMGLAKGGPSKNCKIGTEAPVAIVHDVTSVTDCTDAAAEAWFVA